MKALISLVRLFRQPKLIEKRLRRKIQKLKSRSETCVGSAIHFFGQSVKASEPHPVVALLNLPYCQKKLFAQVFPFLRDQKKTAPPSAPI